MFKKLFHSNKEENLNTSDNSDESDVEKKQSYMPNDKFIKIFEQALKDNNLEGIDYLEFIKSIATLDGIIEDEKVKFQSAFALLKEKGVSSDKLVSTASFYKSVLTKEESSFQEALEKNLKSKVTARKEGIASIKDNIKSKEQKIEALKEEIKKAEVKIKELTTEMEASEAKANETHASFVRAYNFKIQEIDDNIAKIKAYITA